MTDRERVVTGATLGDQPTDADGLRALCDGLPVAVYRRALDGRLHYGNQALVALLGYPPGSAAAEINLEERYFDERDRQRWRSEMETAGCVRSLETRLRRRDGTVVWVQDTARAVRDAEGRTRHYDGVLTDVTDRRHADEWRRRLAAVLEASTDFVATFDAGARLLWVNRAGRRTIGVPDREDLLGAPAARLYPKWAEEIVTREGFPEAEAAGSWSGETALRRRDGYEIPVSQVIVAHASPVGAVDFYSTVARDITERKRSELGVRRHAALLELLQSVTAQAADAARLDEALAIAVREVCHRTAWPVGHAYVRIPGQPALAPTGAWHLADDRFAPFRRATNGTRCPLGDDLPGRAAAARRVEWVEDLRTTTVSVRSAAAPIVAGFAVPVMLDGEPVAVLEFYHDRVVEPDRTLVQVVSQIGERLARVAARQRQDERPRALAAAHGAADDPPDGPLAGSEDSPPDDRHTVLVVDDESAVRAVVRKVLRAHGYRVLEAADGDTAWRALTREPRVDLLLTDMVMPGISGPELAERARAQRADLRVLLMSGYGEDAARWPDGVLAADGVLTKPFSIEGLARRVRDLLGAGSEREPA